MNEQLIELFGFLIIGINIGIVIGILLADYQWKKAVDEYKNQIQRQQQIIDDYNEIWLSESKEE